VPAKTNSGLSQWLRAARNAVVALPHRDRRLRMVMGGLDAAYERAGGPERFDLDTGKLVIFSDHHRGGRDGADDFQRCERAYRSALAYYLEAGHTLVLLGDIEELWECKLPTPLKNYPEVLALERDFAKASRLRRFYGNHDLVWSRPNVVDKFLAGPMGGNVKVREAVRLDLRDGDGSFGEIFLTHGHQGTPDSDLWAPVAMIPVRHVWPRLQRSVKFASTSPARDYKLRGQHDAAMYEWAKRRSEGGHPVVLITGHTHKPVFRRRLASGDVPGDEPVPTVDEARGALDAARRKGQPAGVLSKLRAMLEFVSTKDYGAPAIELSRPCYFNTGCCSFGDGDVTGIEIEGGEIRLVRWPDDHDKPLPQILDHASLREIAGEVAGRPPAQAGAISSDQTFSLPTS
jgi:UDP-2,3-diacylglucosamine pyrophosphatase LpxH